MWGGFGGYWLAELPLPKSETEARSLDRYWHGP